MADKRDMDTFQRIISHRVKSLRTEAGLTQEQLAEAAGIAPQYLSRLETGRQLPSLETLVVLARALNTAPAALLMEPLADPKADYAQRIAAVFATLTDDDAAFLEAQTLGG